MLQHLREAVFPTEVCEELGVVSLRTDVLLFFSTTLREGKCPISFRHGCAKDFSQLAALLRTGKPLFSLLLSDPVF